MLGGFYIQCTCLSQLFTSGITDSLRAPEANILIILGEEYCSTKRVRKETHSRFSDIKFVCKTGGKTVKFVRLWPKVLKFVNKMKLVDRG